MQSFCGSFLPTKRSGRVVRILEIEGSNLGLTQSILTEILGGFPQPFQANSGAVS
jgi:hypothetical protein